MNKTDRTSNMRERLIAMERDQSRLPASERYNRDPDFAVLVDTFYEFLRMAQYTPTELREAALLAAVKFETMVPRTLFKRMSSID